MSAVPAYLDALAQRVLVFDGAMGTNLQEQSLTAADFGGARYEGCMDALCLSRPSAPQAVHEAFLLSGCDVVETNTFQASRIRLSEWGLADHTYEINRAGARIAREACDAFTAADGRPRFVAGSIGPTGLLPSSDDATLSAISFEQLVLTFEEQVKGLLEGGADLLIIETQQDILETKAAIHGCRRAFAKASRGVPLQVQVSLDPNGRMLLGTDIGAVATILEGLGADVIGLNCSTGPEHMREPLRFLAERTALPVSVIPNAGIPLNSGGGKAIYPLDPAGLASALDELVGSLRINAVGGCCGSTAEHLREVVDALRERASAARRVVSGPANVASAIRSVGLQQQPAPALIGERVNTQGSRQAKRLMLADQYDQVVEIAREQVEGGAHLLDVCVALTERADEADQMVEVVKRLRSSIEAPLVIDTTEPEVVRRALEAYPGRAVINSINLESGRAKADAVLALARDHGAAVIALTIDEQGMAHSADRKLEIARRIHAIACGEHALDPGHLIFDVLTFPVTTGQEELRDDARASIEAIRRIKSEIPGVLTNLGVSNVSFGIAPAARAVLNSVFLHHCVEAGLDMAIVNPAQVRPYAEIPDALRTLAEDLIYNTREDALPRFLVAFEGQTEQHAPQAEEDATQPVDERIHQRILLRKKEGIESLLDEALASRLTTDSPSRSEQSAAAVRVLNEVLLPAMKDVGDRFGAGELILPFVLQSAEVMKRSVRHLEQYFEKDTGYTKGTIVVATVFGDVHDIGKALLITILSNNGYTVHDLGKQVPINSILDAARNVKADAIGLSALLVSTSRQMPMCVQELAQRGPHIPVLIGGAAINRAFGQRAAMLPDGQVYDAGVFYCKDVFEGLATLDRLQGGPEERAHVIAGNRAEILRGIAAEEVRPTPSARPRVMPTEGPRRDVEIPRTTIWGPRRLDVRLADVWKHLDRNTLFRLHWGGHRAKGAAYRRVVEEVFEPELARLQEEAVREGWLRPGSVWGAFPCNADSENLVIYDPAASSQDVVLARLNFPRQPGGERLCLADYFRPAATGERDVIVLQAVTAGAEAGAYIEALQRTGDYSRMLYVNGLASSTAEALAEYTNAVVRRELRLPEERGLRFSWGYAACPDLSAQRDVLRVLRASELIHLGLSDSDNLDPEHSTVALFVHHPQAKYFAVRADVAS